MNEPSSSLSSSPRNDNTVFRPGPLPPREWIEGLAGDRRVEDGLRLLQLFDEVTGEIATMWGPSIVGYGSSHYVYASGREGDTCRVGFSPRASAISLYGLLGIPGEAAFLDRLGPHKVGKGCLYVTRLARVDEKVLREMIAAAWAHTRDGTVG